MKTLYSFLHAQFAFPFFITLVCIVPLTVILLLFDAPANTFLLSFYILLMYSFARLSDELTQYRVLLAVAPIAQRTFLQHIFLYYVALSICMFAIYSIIAIFMHFNQLLLHCILLISLQLPLVFLTTTSLYVVISLIILALLFVIDTSTIVLPTAILFIVFVLFITSFFLLNRSKKWRFIA